MSDYNFKKEWPKVKKELGRLSQEALKLAKQGEEQLVKLTHQGKLYVDASALNLKREQLYHTIGKEYVKAHCACPPSAKMQKLLGEISRIEREMKSVKKKMKSQAS